MITRALGNLASRLDDEDRDLVKMLTVRVLALSGGMVFFAFSAGLSLGVAVQAFELAGKL